MSISVIIAAAGSGKRFGSGIPKQYLKLDGVTVLEKALDAFCGFKELIVVTDNIDECRSCLAGRDVKIVRGGAERQDSIRNALSEVTGDYVLIHDAARPFVTQSVIDGVCKALEGGSLAAIPCVRPKNTIRTKEETLDRSSLYEVQTPQGFNTEVLKQAYEYAYSKNFYGTDDAGVAEAYITDKRSDINLDSALVLTEGSYENIKITTPSDMPKEVRFGNGYDVHRLVEGRPLMLGCTHIPYEKGLLGHSDADVLSHAIADAMLGAAALGDIGHIFPDTAAETEGMAGSEILSQCQGLIEKLGYSVMMIDGTVITEKPKLAPHILTMRENTAKALGIDVSKVSIKATTEENMSDVSRNGMAAIATCVLVK